MSSTCLKHVSCTDDVLTSFTNTGTIFRVDDGLTIDIDDPSQDSSHSYPMTNQSIQVGRGGVKFAYANLKNNRLITQIDIIPTISLITVGGSQGVNYGLIKHYWPYVSGSDGQPSSNYYFNVGASANSTVKSVCHAGDYYKFVLYINDRGEESTIEKTIDIGLNNTIAKISLTSLGYYSVYFDNEIIGKYSSDAYTTRVDIMESNKESGGQWYSALICGIRFRVNTPSAS